MRRKPCSVEDFNFNFRVHYSIVLCFGTAKSKGVSIHINLVADLPISFLLAKELGHVFARNQSYFFEIQVYGFEI